MKWSLGASTSLSLHNSVRLACVKHAASVHPEPGSNSHVYSPGSKTFWLSIRGMISHSSWCFVLLFWNSSLEFSGLHCCLFVKVQARQIVVQSFWKACFHKMYCAMRCCATALSEQCFSASCPCFCVASFRLCHPQRCILYHPPQWLSTLILKIFQIFFDKLRKPWFYRVFQHFFFE